MKHKITIAELKSNMAIIKFQMNAIRWMQWERRMKKLKVKASVNDKPLTRELTDF